MPKLHKYKNKPGYYILTRYRKRMITYQISQEGAEYLENKHLNDESQVDWEVINYLKSRGWVYTNKGGSEPTELPLYDIQADIQKSNLEIRTVELYEEKPPQLPYWREPSSSNELKYNYFEIYYKEILSITVLIIATILILLVALNSKFAPDKPNRVTHIKKRPNKQKKAVPKTTQKLDPFQQACQKIQDATKIKQQDLILLFTIGEIFNDKDIISLGELFIYCYSITNFGGKRLLQITLSIAEDAKNFNMLLPCTMTLAAFALDYDIYKPVESADAIAKLIDKVISTPTILAKYGGINQREYYLAAKAAQNGDEYGSNVILVWLKSMQIEHSKDKIKRINKRLFPKYFNSISNLINKVDEINAQMKKATALYEEICRKRKHK